MTPEMRTRSPAFSPWTSASDSGVRTSLVPSEPVVTLTTSLPCADARGIRFPRRGAAPPFRTSPLRWRRRSRRSNGGGYRAAQPSSQGHFLVSMRVAFDGDGDGERGDVTGIGEDVDAERRGVAAVALRPDAQPVGAREQLLLQRVQGRIRIRRAELAEERLLGQDRGLLERAADADAEDERPAGDPADLL